MTDISTYGDLTTRDILSRDITLFNNTEEDTAAGRSTTVLFDGEKGDGTAHNLASIVTSHEGAADDYKGQMKIYTNDGSTATSLVEAMSISSAGVVSFPQGFGGNQATLDLTGQFTQDSGLNTDNIMQFEAEGTGNTQFNFYDEDNTTDAFNFLHDRAGDTFAITENGGEGMTMANTGEVTFSQTVTFSDAANGIDVTNNALIGGTLGVTGIATFTAQTVHTGGLQSVGDVIVDAGTGNNGSVIIQTEGVASGFVTFNDVTGATDAFHIEHDRVADTLAITENGGEGITMDNAGLTSFSQKATFAATGTALDVTNNATIGGTLGVVGTASFTNAGTGIDVTNNALIGGTLGVTGVATFTAQSVHTGGLQSVGNAIVDAGSGNDGSVIIQTEGAASGYVTFNDVTGAADAFYIKHDRAADTLEITENGGEGMTMDNAGLASFSQKVTLAATGTGLDVTNNADVGGDLTVTGNLTVNGTTTTINTATLTVDDHNIEMGAVDTPTDITANGGGIILKGDTDKSILWDSTDGSWDSTEDFNLVTGKEFRINDTRILSETEVATALAGGFYIGDSATNGSWRIAVDTGVFVIQTRVGGSWVTKSSVSA